MIKELVGAGIIYAGLTGLATSGIQRIDGYTIRKTYGLTEVWPAPDYTKASLVDNNNDGIPDRKYTYTASRQGIWPHDFPITEKDKEIFSDIVSRL